MRTDQMQAAAFRLRRSFRLACTMSLSREMSGDRIITDVKAAKERDLQMIYALRVRDAKFTSRSVKSVRSRITTINEHAPGQITMEEFKTVLKQQVFAENDITETDQEDVQLLQHEKYETWDWNYGFCRAYSVRREQKFEGGLITVDMDVVHGVISALRLSGDFFGSGDLRVLERSLVGVPLDRQLAQRLAELGIENYIHGVTAADMALLMK